MIGTQWLLCFVLTFGQSLSFLDKREKTFGDVTDEEVVIDHLEDYLQGHSHSNRLDSGDDPRSYDYQAPDFRSAFKLDEKIEFAVSPRDPRYFLPSSVLRSGELVPLNIVGHGLPPIGRTHIEGIPPLIHATRDILPLNHDPTENIIKNPDFGVEPGIPHHTPLLRELYSRFSPGAYGGGYGTDDGEEGTTGFYRGHKFGPQAVENGDSKSKSESVNFLQESRHQAEVPEFFVQQQDSGAISDFYFVALVSGCTAAAVCAVVGAGICYLKLHKSKRDAADTEYPAYGVTGPCKDFSPAAADRKLAQSAHMFHYQHQKQQMIALEKSSGDDRHCSTSDVDSEEEGEEGDYTVYECPGLAPTDEMEVKNPLFSDDPTPATPGKQQKDQEKKEGDEDEEEEELENR